METPPAELCCEEQACHDIQMISAVVSGGWVYVELDGLTI